MKRLFFLSGLVLLAACEPATVDTIAPRDASFQLACAGNCGPTGRDAAILIDVQFGGRYSRQLALCCQQRAPLLARLQTITDFWCDGLDVPDSKVGDLNIGTTQSEATGLRGATLSQGEGYVSFNCEQWLPELIAKLKQSDCCPEPLPATPAAPLSTASKHAVAGQAVANAPPAP